MAKKNKKHLVGLVTEYAKLQLASNIPFWGTYFGFALLEGIFHMPSFWALAIPTILSNIVFFVVDDKWVFASARGKRKSPFEIIKFIIFMTFSAMIVFAMTYSLEQYFNITPYLGQFISGFAASLWTFLGRRVWVFAPPRHHGLTIIFRKQRKTS